MYVCMCFIRYRTFVSEDAGPNTLVATVLAKDPDGDGITYKITTGNEEGNFVIDNQKGQTYICICIYILCCPVLLYNNNIIIHADIL